MTEEDLRNRIGDSYRFCLFLIITEVLEGAAILVTLLVHAGLSQVLDALPLTGTQKVIAGVFKVILFAAPFFAILVHVIREFRRILTVLEHHRHHNHSLTPAMAGAAMGRGTVGPRTVPLRRLGPRLASRRSDRIGAVPKPAKRSDRRIPYPPGTTASSHSPKQPG